MRELPGYKHAGRPSYRPISPEDVESYRKRIEMTWEKDNEPRQSYRIFFRSSARAFCEVCGCALSIADEVTAAEFRWRDGRSSVTVTCTYDALQRLKQAVKGCSVTDTAVRFL